MDTQSFHLFLQAPVGITILKSPDFIVEMANPRYLEIVGKEEENFVGFPLLQALPEIKDQQFIQLLENVISTRELYQSDETAVCIVRHNKMVEIYVNFVYQPIVEVDGTVSRILVIVHEVTEMVIARNKIEEAGQRTRLAVEAAQIGTFEWNQADDSFVYSERFAEIFGYPGQMTLDKKHFLNLIHPDDQKIRSEAHKESLKTGFLLYEVRIILPGQTIRWIKLNGKASPKKEGGAYRMYGTVLDVTDQRNTAEVLRQNEEQLRVALEASDMGYWNVDPHTSVLFCSERTKEFLGLSGDGGMDMKIALDRIPAGDRQRVENEIQKAWRPYSGGNFESEFRIINALDNKERIIRASGKTYFTPEGFPFRFSGTIQDVTQRTIAKRKLEESEARYRQLISGLPVGVYTVDKDGTILLYNEVAVLLWGRTPQLNTELWSGALRLGKTDGTWLKHEESNLAVALRENRSFCGEAVIERPDGEKRFVLEYPEPMHDLDGTMIGAINVMVDITERSLAEAALEESEARFRLLANFMPQLIWTGDAAGNLNYYNQAVYDYSGYDYQQIQNDGWLKIVHPDDRGENTTRWIRSITTGEDFTFEHRFRRQDGEYRWQLSRALPQKDANGNVTMWIGTSTDIHDQKIISAELEKRVQERTSDLQQANYALEQSNNELEQFAFAASHDMQEPLRKIQTFITFLIVNEAEPLSDRAKNYLAKINNASLRMKALIDSLLNYSQLSNYANHTFVSTDLNAIIADVINDLELIISEKQATVTCSNLPVIRAIPLQMTQLFYNLISNSLKFAKAAEPPLIQIKCTPHKVPLPENQSNADNGQPVVRISVSDNGIGFEQKYAHKVFDLFQRLNDKYSYEGTGIGLALCKKVVHNHAGQIFAVSKEGIGTEFSISLPLQ